MEGFGVEGIPERSGQLRPQQQKLHSEVWHSSLVTSDAEAQAG